MHIYFTNKRIEHKVHEYKNDQVVMYDNSANYFGMMLDVKLKLKRHVKKKREELKLKCRKVKFGSLFSPINI